MSCVTMINMRWRELNNIREMNFYTPLKKRNGRQNELMGTFCHVFPHTKMFSQYLQSGHSEKSHFNQLSLASSSRFILWKI